MTRMCVSLKFPVFTIFCLMKLSLGTDEQEIPKERQDILRLSRDCPSLKIRLDQYETVRLISNSRHNVTIPGNITCTAHYMTGNPDQGICIEKTDLFFNTPASGPQLRIYTTRFGPEKTFDHAYHDFSKWCTRESLVSIELTSTHAFNDIDADYGFRFLFTNVSKDSISRNWKGNERSNALACCGTTGRGPSVDRKDIITDIRDGMHSFKHCNRSEILKSGETIHIYSQQHTAQNEPQSSCMMTFSTDNDEEHVEVCLQVKKLEKKDKCRSSLTVSGFNTRFWPQSEVLGCDDTNSMLSEKKEMCSGSKTLTLALTTTSNADTGLDFTAEIKVKKHPYWKVIEDENSELRGLGFVKGITYFVAVIDSLAGIFAAILTSMFKRPRFFWKSWAESLKIPEKCNAIHYDDTYSADCSKNVDEILEVKSY